MQWLVHRKPNLKYFQMKSYPIPLPAIAVISFFVLIGCSSKQDLFNGKDLTGWDTYLGPVYDTARQKFDSLKVGGLNNDVDKVFAVVKEDGQAALRISGQHFGGISSVQEYADYHLTLQFKWGNLRWPPKKKSKRDSGLLYHGVGEHGSDYGFWLRSQEFQIQEGDCGDYWGVAGGSFEIPAIKNDSGDYVYDANGPQIIFAQASEAGRHCIKNPDAEKPSGKWNTLELYCLGDTSVHIVNRKVTMVLYNSKQTVDSVTTELKKGKIQLQSEGAEVFYRGIQIESISSLPKF
jgi:Domain of Unknown Function (DUF1080)